MDTITTITTITTAIAITTIAVAIADQTATPRSWWWFVLLLLLLLLLLFVLLLLSSFTYTNDNTNNDIDNNNIIIIISSIFYEVLVPVAPVPNYVLQVVILQFNILHYISSCPISFYSISIIPYCIMLYEYVCMHVCMYVCMHVCMYVCKMATAQAILAQRDVTAPWFSAVRPRGCEVAARWWDRKVDGRLPGPIVFPPPPR